MTDRKPKKGDLVSYHTSQLEILGPCQGALGVVFDGPDTHGKMAVKWVKQKPLDKLFIWNSVENLRIESPSRPRVEPAPKSFESPVFLEAADDEEFENDELF
jgi:hypothetical protein|tara:strand:+ start:16099 stop:16404 length:306 start_codon:yes stop_codon:yes gene_type:complete